MSRIIPIVTMMLLTALPYAASEQDATKLQITDKDGAVTVVTGLDFDYSNYPGGFGWYKPDHERQGLRMRQGQSTTTVAWRNIASLTVEPEAIYVVTVKCSDQEQQFSAADKTKWEELTKGACRQGQIYKYSGQFQLTSGRTVTAELVTPSGELKGDSDLGEFAIALKNVKQIRPIK